MYLLGNKPGDSQRQLCYRDFENFLLLSALWDFLGSRYHCTQISLTQSLHCSCRIEFDQSIGVCACVDMCMYECVCVY